MSRAVDATGRLDIFAIRLLERFVETRLGRAEQIVYQRLKPSIDRAIRKHVGRARLSAVELAAIRDTVQQAAFRLAQLRQQGGKAA